MIPRQVYAEVLGQVVPGRWKFNVCGNKDVCRDPLAKCGESEHVTFTFEGESSLVPELHVGDVQLHVEFAMPNPANGTSQSRGNSGLIFMGQYELQLLDSYNNRTYSNGQAGSIYKQSIPLVNAARRPHTAYFLWLFTTLNLLMGAGYFLFSGLGTILFLLITRNKLPSYLGSSFAFIAPIVSRYSAVSLGNVPVTTFPPKVSTILGSGAVIMRAMAASSRGGKRW